MAKPKLRLLLRLADVLEMLPVSRTTLWRLIRRGEFPRPFKLTPGAYTWDRAEVEQWLVDRRGASK